MTAGLYRAIRDDIEAVWTAGWASPAVPVFWRSNDLDVMPDALRVPVFVRAEVDFGRERVIGFGGGLGRNQRAQFGSVVLRVFAARQRVSEDDALDRMAEACAVFRSYRGAGSYGTGSDLSFIGDGSGFDVDPVEIGNWFARGAIVVFQYRFTG